MSASPTSGEKLLIRLLRDLPRGQFFAHYEPHLVTPEGSSRPDFVIVAARLGVVVLEVKDWARLTGGDQQVVHTIRSDGQPATYENPIRTAERYAHDLNRRFEGRAELWEHYRGRRALRFPWQVMIALPRISQPVIAQFEKKGVWPLHTVIGRESLASAAHLQSAIQDLPWKFHLSGPLPLDLLDILREILNPSLVVHNDDGLPVGTLTRVQYGLITEPLHTASPRQLPLFDEDDEETGPSLPADGPAVRLVRGVAGSGKTLVLIRRARHLADLYPDARLLVLTFNVELARDLRARIALPGERALVTNFHQLCRLILADRWREPLRARDWLRQHERAALQEVGLKADYVAAEFAWRREMNLQDDAAYLKADRSGRGQRLDRAHRQAVNALFARYRAHRSALVARGETWFDWDDVAALALADLPDHPYRAAFDAVLLDEGQDFSPSWIRLVRALLRPSGSLFVCDDPSQSIFRSYNWSQKGLSVAGRTRLLRVPFRATREISQAAHSLVEADPALREVEDRAQPDLTSYELGSGPPPALVNCPDAGSEVAFVTARVQEWIAAGLAPHHIAVLCHARWHLQRWGHLREQGVYVMNFDRIKGLEFPAVILPHLHDAFRQPSDPEEVTAVRRRVFTAMTRARYRLVMTYQRVLPSPLDPVLDYVWQDTAAPVVHVPGGSHR